MLVCIILICRLALCISSPRAPTSTLSPCLREVTTHAAAAHSTAQEDEGLHTPPHNPFTGSEPRPSNSANEQVTPVHPPPRFPKLWFKRRIEPIQSPPTERNWWEVRSHQWRNNHVADSKAASHADVSRVALKDNSNLPIPGMNSNYKGKASNYKSDYQYTNKKPDSMAQPENSMPVPSSITNPFGIASYQTKSQGNNVFGAPSRNPFESAQIPPSSSKAVENPFETRPQSYNPFAPARPNPFGSAQSSPNPQKPGHNPFGNAEVSSNSHKPARNPFGNTQPSSNLQKPAYNPFATKSQAKPVSATPPRKPFDSPAMISDSQKPAPTPPSISIPPAQTTMNNVGFGMAAGSRKQSASGFFSQSAAVARPRSPPSKESIASKIEDCLRRAKLVAPPGLTGVEDTSQKGLFESMWRKSKAFRAKMRQSLELAGLIDDPEKPKKLSEAIPFKGICEQMCPEFERMTRIMESNVPGPEKEADAYGNFWPSQKKMVKANARSAAGQEEPLPMDVRSPAALRRTVDYLLDDLLGDDDTRLPIIHGYLWDRTRAIRTDFTRQQHSMELSEWFDYVYCLERITRFHVISLHQLSKDDNAAEFVEQQEVEQLGKTIHSLLEAYTDLRKRKATCPNEYEFRAYYVLFNKNTTDILETAQGWGYEFWTEDMQAACSLVEMVQNNWDTHGPLRPLAPSDIAQNAASRFFSIIEDKKISYTMACFAEIFFNDARKAILKTILMSYRKQRDQTKDWTLAELNKYLRFDYEQDIIEFGEAYGVTFSEHDGETYLSFDGAISVDDPFPKLKQRHSYCLVERKRGSRSLPVVMAGTVYEEEIIEGEEESRKEEPEEEMLEDDDDGELFVKDNNPGPSFTPATFQNDNEYDMAKETSGNHGANVVGTQSSPPVQAIKPVSVFDQVATKKDFGPSFFGPNSKVTSAESPAPKYTAPPSTFNFSSTQPPTELHVQPVTGFASELSTTPTQSPPASAVEHLQRQELAPKKSVTFTFDQTSDATSAATPKPTFGGSAPSILKHTPPALGSPAGQSPKLGPSNASLTQANTGLPMSQTATEPTILPSLAPSSSLNNTASYIPNPAAEAHEKDVQLTKFVNWFVAGEGGFMTDLSVAVVDMAVAYEMQIFEEEMAVERAHAEAEVAREKAEAYRSHCLSRKYGQRWYKLFHDARLRRIGREARKAREEMARSARASKASIVEDFRASTRNVQRRNSLESLINATGVLDGMHDPEEQVRAIVRDDAKRPMNGELLRLSEERVREIVQEELAKKSSNISKKRRVNRSSTSTPKRDNPLRRSILSDPSYLSGESRIHHMSNYNAYGSGQKQVSGVQTDYFRLKARGIRTMPDGTPLANSVARSVLRPKQSFDGSSTPQTPRFTQSLDSSSASAADAIRQASRKRSLEDDGNDDTELFKELAKVKAAMDEGAQWYREERLRMSGSGSRSHS